MFSWGLPVYLLTLPIPGAPSTGNPSMPGLIGKGATIGANATVVCGHDIGAYAFIGAGAVVTKHVPDYALLVGNPARQLGWMSEYGHRLYFDNEGIAECPESHEKYQLKDGKVFKL